MHLAVDNRLEEKADLSVSHPGSGMGWSLPTGESERIANIPPGKVEVHCYGRSWVRDRLFALESGAVESSRETRAY